MRAPTADGCTLDAVGILERDVIVTMAGDVAERRCMRGSEPGWHRHRTRDERIAFHEAGHACVAASHGRFIYRASIVPDKSIDYGAGYHQGGHILHGSGPEWSGEEPTENLTDRKTIARMCWVMANQPGWKGALKRARGLRLRTEQAVEQNWPAIVALAAKLERQRVLDRDELAAFARDHIHIAA